MSIFFSLFFSLIEEIIYTRYGYRDISRVVMNLFFDFCAAQQQNDMISNDVMYDTPKTKTYHTSQTRPEIFKTERGREGGKESQGKLERCQWSVCFYLLCSQQ